MFYSERLWKIVQYVPLLFIIWHIYLAVTHDPGLFAIGWILETIWVGLYYTAFIAMREKKTWGYWYIIFFIAVNSAWEIRLSYQMLNELRLFYSSLPILLIAFVYLNRFRFNVKPRSQILVWLIVSMLIGGASLSAAKIIMHNKLPEVSQWKTSSTGTATSPSLDDISWYKDKEIIGSVFQVQPIKARTKEETKFSIVILNLSSGQMKVIDTSGKRPSLSNDRQWVCYWSSEGYIRYNVAKGTKEKLFKGPVYFLDEPMAPSGDKLVLRQGPQPIEVFTTNEPHWQIYRWSRKTHPGLTKIIWSRDGNSLLALKSSPSKSKAYPYVLAFYRPDGKELNEIPFSNFIKYVKEIKFGPEGTTIYAHTEHHDKMEAIDMYDLKDPQSGWRTLVTPPSGIFKWEVGPGGLLVYNHSASENGYYNYIFSSPIGLRGLWLYQKDMERPIRLTGYADRVLAISPDGNTILFGRERPDPRSSQYPIQSDIMQLTRSRN